MARHRSRRRVAATASRSAYEKHGNRNSNERIFCKAKTPNLLVLELFQSRQPETADEWLRSFTSYGIGFSEDHAWPP
jgi:hypothetical protein